MVKSLDGIKKLNPDDVKKYRKIVLNYIGEKDPAEVKEKLDSKSDISPLRRVDGVKANKTGNLKAKIKAELPRSRAAESASIIQPVNPEKSDQSEAKRLKEAVRRQEEERRRIKEEERQHRLSQEHDEEERRKQEERRRLENIKMEREKIKQERKKQIEIAERARRRAEAARQAEESKQWAEKMRLEEIARAEQRRIKENRRLEKAKRREEIIRLKEEMKMKKRAAREKKMIRRQKAWRKFKKKAFLEFQNFYLIARKHIVYIVSLAVIFSAVVYLILCLAVLRFNNGFTGRIANYLSVPAVITNHGIISYNDFRKIKDSNYLNLNLGGKRAYLADWLAWRDLSIKYELPVNATREDLAIKYVLDKDFNQIGLSRINKINALLNEGSEFESLGKYADEYNGGTYYDSKSAADKFGSTVSGLANNQVSKIIAQADGYYIIQRIDDKNGQLGLKYIFIKAQTLDQYIQKQLTKAKVFILAN